MKAYHVTLHKNLSKIMSEGLIPQIGDRSMSLGENEEAIYLFPDLDSVEDALMNWLGEEFDEDEELVILEIDLSNIPHERSEEHFEIIILEKISPDKVSFLKKC